MTAQSRDSELACVIKVLCEELTCTACAQLHWWHAAMWVI